MDGTTIMVLYDGALTYLPIRRPSKEEVKFFRRMDPWDPFLLNDKFSHMKSLTVHIGMESLVDDVTKVNPIRSEFMSTMLYENFNTHTILRYHVIESAKDMKYSTLAAMNSSKGADYITPE